MKKFFDTYLLEKQISHSSQIGIPASRSMVQKIEGNDHGLEGYGMVDMMNKKRLLMVDTADTVGMEEMDYIEDTLDLVGMAEVAYIEEIDGDTLTDSKTSF